MRVYVHADLDAFFASAEILKTPSLRGRAFVVGSEGYRERYRGVALTATYEARAYGIRSGMSIAECYRRCPTLLYREPDHPFYRELSERVMGILSEFTDNLIQTSVDEAYMTFEGELEEIVGRCSEIKESVRKRTGLTLTVGGGVAPMIAKIASSLSKPDGLLIVSPGEEAEILMNAPISVVPGVGTVSRRNLEREGVKTIGDLYSLGRGKVWELAGEVGVNLINILEGRRFDWDRFLKSGPRKSFSRQRRWYPPEGRKPQDEECINVWLRVIREISEDLTEEARGEGAMASVVSISMKGKGWHVSRSEKLPAPTWNAKKVFQVSKGLFIKELKRGRVKARELRKVSVRVSVGRRVVGGQRFLEDF